MSREPEGRRWWAIATIMGAGFILLLLVWSVVVYVPFGDPSGAVVLFGSVATLAGLWCMLGDEFGRG